jgi:hypothetical protein
MRKFYLILACFLPTIAGAQDGVRPRAVSFESSALQEIGPWGAAALPDGLVPLPSDLWRGSDAGTLGVLFAKITPDQRFPSLQNLTRQAIFSGGTAPTTDSDVTRGRFEAANRLGPAEATVRLVFGVPRLASEAGLAAIAIEAGLRVGRIDDACNLIEAVAAPPQGTTWLEARATCFALNDEGAAANLSVDLAKVRGLTDTWLSRAIAAVGGPLTAPPPFRIDSGRAIALSLRAKLKPPVTLVATQDPMALSALIGTSEFMASLPPQERLALARNGASRGVVPLATLVRLQPISEPVAGEPTTGTSTQPPSSLPPSSLPPSNLAVQPSPAPIVPTPILPVQPLPAQITQKLLAAPSLALRAIEAKLGLGDIKSVMATQPGLMTLADVPVLTEAALWSGDGALASSIASLSPEALDPRLALVLALYDPTKQTQIIEQRIDKAGNDPVARRIAARDAVVAWSAGLPVGGGLSLLVQSGLPWGPAGNAGLRTALELASHRGSKGEVILLTGLALQGVEPASVDPETLIAAVTALRRVGLPEAARDLARDYLLATFVTLPVRPPTRARSAATSNEAPPPVQAARVAPTPTVSPASPPTPISAPAARAAPTPALAPVLRRPTAPAAQALQTPRPAQRPIARAAQSPSPIVPTNRAKPTWGTP